MLHNFDNLYLLSIKNSLNDMAYTVSAQSDMMIVSALTVLTPHEQNPVVMSNKWLTTGLQWLQKQNIACENLLQEWSECIVVQ